MLFIAGRLTRPIEAFVARLARLREHDVASLQAGLESLAEGDLTSAPRSTRPSWTT